VITVQPTSPPPPPRPPRSATCDRPWSTDPTRRCIARTVKGSDRCLAHTDHRDRRELLAKQASDGTIDLTDAEVDTDLGEELLGILLSSRLPTVVAERATFSRGFFSPDAASPALFLGDVNFGDATFVERSNFEGAIFCGSANFGGTKFSSATSFDGALFCREPSFGRTHFASAASFDGAYFHQGAAFGHAKFSNICNFQNAVFREGTATFDRAEFLGFASFRGSHFNRNAKFGYAKFEDGARFDAATFSGRSSFSGATFLLAVSFDKAHLLHPVAFKRTTLAPHLYLDMMPESAPIIFDAIRLVGPTVIEIANVHLCFSNVGLVEYLTIEGTSESESYLDELCNSTLAKPLTIGEGVTLKDTSFLGTTGLELVRVADAKWRTAERRWQVGRRSHRARQGRKMLADESKIDTTMEAELLRSRYRAVEGLYRQFRSGLESSKAAPAAADFYYGELEMRRLAATPRSFERVLLWCYKYFGGYGVGASLPFLAWIGLIVLSMTAVFARSADFADKTDPNSPHLSSLGSAIILVLHNSVNLFGAPASGLTNFGTIYMIVERVCAVALLSLGVFALRSRVQR
jgi:uncharacterized protein YjbI with pentapeptide repeats